VCRSKPTLRRLGYSICNSCTIDAALVVSFARPLTSSSASAEWAVEFSIRTDALPRLAQVNLTVLQDQASGRVAPVQNISAGFIVDPEELNGYLILKPYLTTRLRSLSYHKTLINSPSCHQRHREKPRPWDSSFTHCPFHKQLRLLLLSWVSIVTKAILKLRTNL
jgi:hypothetical protein